MSDRDKPTQRTDKGYELPVPKRGDFFRNLRKVLKPDDGSGRGERGVEGIRPKSE